jgi:hypothetical protein
VGAIAGETGVPASAIGAIEIADSYSLVSVPEEFVEQVIAGMKEATLRGQKVTIRASASGRASIFEVSVASAHRASRRARRQATAVGPGRSDCSRRDTRQG